jgi:hypothetical protein
MRPASLQAGVLFFALGIGVEAAGLVAMRVDHFDIGLDISLLGLCMYFFGPALAVVGSIILALGATKKVWFACIPATVLAVALGAGSVMAYQRIASERGCDRGDATACLVRARAAFTTADAARFDELACRRGEPAGCKRWDREDPNATANEAYAKYCETNRFSGARGCPATDPDFRGACTRDPSDWQCR